MVAKGLVLRPLATAQASVGDSRVERRRLRVPNSPDLCLCTLRDWVHTLMAQDERGIGAAAVETKSPGSRTPTATLSRSPHSPRRCPCAPGMCDQLRRSLSSPLRSSVTDNVLA